jgi:hypothetical protein
MLALGSLAPTRDDGREPLGHGDRIGGGGMRNNVPENVPASPSRRLP